ncbi:hypothetical protein BGZ95_011913 [Linnemannia exigua]|uniref:Uncharacterized protein n=1 Tax=Linnemannia exigua TaxID=604196 RepID=A0AAD4D9A5_9FUNG|nr:hypothetical protein BGZ95_011913 [Linnemannia exigua]
MSPSLLYKNCHKFFALLELIENLCLWLDNKHILKLMLTSKGLYDAAAPCLWRNVNLYDDYRVELLYTNSNYKRKQGDDEPQKQDSNDSKKRVQTVAQPTFKTRSLEAGYAFLSYYLEGVHDSLYMEAEKKVPRPHNWISDDRASFFSKPIPLITKLRRLDVSLQGPALRTSRRSFFVDLRQAPAITPRLFRFMTCNAKTLTDVCLRDVPIPTLVDIRHLCRTISRLECLTHLTIDIPLAKTRRQKLACSVVLMIFFCCPPSLVSFKLRTTVCGDGQHEILESFLTPSVEDSDFEEKQVLPRQGPLPNLKVLELPQHETGYNTNLLRAVLGHCPALEEWDVPFVDERDDVVGLVDFFQHNKNPETTGKHLSALRHLHYTHPGTDGKGETAAAIIEMIPENQLESLTFHGYEDTIPDDPNNLGRFTRCFLLHSTSLVSIKLQDMDRIESKTIKGILTNCEALETLVLTCPETMLSRLTLDDATINNWKCVNLKELRMAVDLRPGYPNTHKMLEKFYNQLGVLKNLEILDLMSACRRPNHTSAHYSETAMTCMLSLGSLDGPSGFLNSLAGLKNLRVLLGSFFLKNPETSNMLDKDEVKWILDNWPHLEVIEFFSFRDRIHTSHKHINDMKVQRPNLQFFRKVN